MTLFNAKVVIYRNISINCFEWCNLSQNIRDITDFPRYLAEILFIFVGKIVSALELGQLTTMTYGPPFTNVI